MKRQPTARRDRQRSGPTQTERIEAARRDRRRRRRRTRIAGSAAALLVVGSVVAWSLYRRSEARQLEAILESGSCRVDREADAGSGDVDQPPTYEVEPPAGGPHARSVASAGVYQVDRAPRDGLVVHALEHGLVSVWYRPGLPQSDEVVALADRFPEDVLVLPRAGLRTPLAATAWHRRLLCDEPEIRTVERFVREFRGKGPERVVR